MRKTVIYADHAATTRLDEGALREMLPWLQDEYANASQPYSFARSAKKALRSARETIAACIGAEPDEIYFTSGGTESDNWALKGCALFHAKNELIITSAIEHHAVLHSCRALERMEHPVLYLPVDASGVIQPDTLTRHMTQRVHLVSLMYANNEIGTIQPIERLAEIAHKHGALFHTDAVQAVGHVPLHVHASGIDLLSASAHKFNGPKGIGFLYIRNGIKLSPLLDGGAQEEGHRAGTENIASIVGMAAALKKSCDAMRERTVHLKDLEYLLIESLQERKIDFIRNGAHSCLPGNISLSFKGADGESLLHRLDLMGIAVSTGAACDTVSTKLSHVIQAIHVPKEYAYGTVRISLGYENTAEEMETIADSLYKIIKSPLARC